MHLFKRFLLSLFPDSMGDDSISPANMFVSFISSKQFFSVVSRRLIENHKLNMFDVSLESIDAKLGFGDSKFDKKQTKKYYNYNIASSFNGYRFYTPSNIGGGNTIAMSCILEDYFRDKKPVYFLTFLKALYFIHFIFAGKIKVFPYEDKKDNYSWFVEVFFDYYRLVLDSRSVDIDKTEFQNIKNHLLNEYMQVFFYLFYVCKRLGGIYQIPKNTLGDFYEYLFDVDNTSEKQDKRIIKQFIENHNSIYKPVFTQKDKTVSKYILPADSNIKYFFNGDDVFLTSDIMAGNIYDREKLQKYLDSFLTSGDKLQDFLEYILDYHNFKENYFLAIKKYMMHKFKEDDYDPEEKHIQEVISSIGDDPSKINDIDIPERFKKESVTMERLVNFYITFVSGLWIGRGNSLYSHMYKSDLIDAVSDIESIFSNGSSRLDKKAISSYLQNDYFYKRVLSKVRAGKEKFSLKLPGSDLDVNFESKYLVEYFIKQSWMSMIFQDINIRDMQLYLEDDDIVDTFRSLVGDELSRIISLEDENFVQEVYKPVWNVFENIKSCDLSDITASIQKAIQNKEISNIKNSMYSCDFWVWKDTVSLFENTKDLQKDDIWRMAMLREHIWGLLLFMHFIKIQDSSSSRTYKSIIDVYNYNILAFDKSGLDEMHKIIVKIHNRYDGLLTKWIKIDDNYEFLETVYESWADYVQKVDKRKRLAYRIDENDILWLRNLLKNITFYNKRFMVPKDKNL